MRPPCSLCLCGEQSRIEIHHGGTENTEDAQRMPKYDAGYQTAVTAPGPEMA